MTTTTDEIDLHPCACGCGAMVKGKWARGHWARAQKANRELQPLPGPDDEPGEDDDEDLPAELVAELDDMERLAWITDTPAHPDSAEDGPGEVPPDPPAGRIPPPRGGTGGTARKRATATVQRDVTAKIRMVLVPAGRLWAVRDQVCGPVFVEQEPEISAALAEIVCDSPDLLNWFTGPAGGYMKYFRLLMAVQPVVLVLWLHHVAHARQVAVPNPQQPPQQAYAA